MSHAARARRASPASEGVPRRSGPHGRRCERGKDHVRSSQAPRPAPRETGELRTGRPPGQGDGVAEPRAELPAGGRVLRGGRRVAILGLLEVLILLVLLLLLLLLVVVVLQLLLLLLLLVLLREPASWAAPGRSAYQRARGKLPIRWRRAALGTLAALFPRTWTQRMSAPFLQLIVCWRICTPCTMHFQRHGIALGAKHRSVSDSARTAQTRALGCSEVSEAGLPGNCLPGRRRHLGPPSDEARGAGLAGNGGGASEAAGHTIT